MINLRLLQISDSALPVGGYTHSWGLEAAIARRQVHDAQSLETWASDYLRHVLGPLEGVVVASACRAAGAHDWPRIRKGNTLLTASMAPPSLRAASLEMGEQLLSLGSTWAWSAQSVAQFAQAAGRRSHAPEWNHAVVFGMLGAFAGAAPEEALAAYFHQAMLGIIGAGVRAVPVGHTHGQQILAYLHEEIESIASEIESRDLETAGSGCPFYEVLCDEQTKLYSRVFRS